jgi:hypothetical protein
MCRSSGAISPYSGSYLSSSLREKFEIPRGEISSEEWRDLSCDQRAKTRF